MEKNKSTLTLGKNTLSLSNTAKPAPSGSAPVRGKGVQVQVKKKRLPRGEKKAAEESQENASATQANSHRPRQDGLTNQEHESRLKALKHASENPTLVPSFPDFEEDDDVEEVETKTSEETEKEKETEAATPTEPTAVVPTEELVAKERAKKTYKAEKETERRPEHAAKQTKKRRGSKHITVTEALNKESNEEKTRSLAAVKRARDKKRRKQQNFTPTTEKIIREVTIPETISVQELANRMAERLVDVNKALMKMGIIATAHQDIDADTAEILVGEFGHNFKRVTDADIENILIDQEIDPKDLISRPPVVTFMGHVDHGKTSLLDALRQTHVADKESGGITQHIGAYQVTTKDDAVVTFLDTPGHEAFTEMRKRGAHATDVVVLVVAADDGIMAQTIEAIHHAKAAEVPIIVAINKIDKPDADPDKIRQTLLEYELVDESYGGDTLIVEVSAKESRNLDGLLEAILLQSELLELQTSARCAASGVIVESSLNKSRGVIATLLVQKGTLRIGDLVVSGESYGRIRAMQNDIGTHVEEGSPSMPLAIMGFNEPPAVGSIFSVVTTEKQAREITEYRQKRLRNERTSRSDTTSIEELFQQARGQGTQRHLPIIIKGDAQGSIEAIIGSLDKLATDEVAVKVLHSAPGAITTSDISLAAASSAMIVGFNVRANADAKESLHKEDVNIHYYSIIYNLIDDVKAVLSGMLKPKIRENYFGTAEIRDVFNITKVGKIAGCYVTDGHVKRGAKVRLLREDVVIHEGTLKTLRRFKDDVKEVKNNFECGMAFENYDDIKAGDKIEAFEIIEEKRSL